MSADVQRRETKICIFSDASRSACHCGHAPEVTAPTLFSIDGSFIEQRGYKDVHWKIVIRLEI